MTIPMPNALISRSEIRNVRSSAPVANLNRIKLLTVVMRRRFMLFFFLRKDESYKKYISRSKLNTTGNVI